MRVNWMVINWQMMWNNNTTIIWNWVVRDKMINIYDWFHWIDLKWSINVDVIKWQKNELVIEWESNIIENIDIENINWILNIQFKNGFSFSTEYWIQIDITTNNILNQMNYPTLKCRVSCFIDHTCQTEITQQGIGVNRHKLFSSMTG